MEHHRRLNILMIEDNEGDVMLTKMAFKKADVECKIFVARDGYEGMQFLHKEGQFCHMPTPNLVLLDINMPRMDGREVLKNMKSDDQLKTIPVIMLTSSQSDGDIADTYKEHANSYIVKPASMNKFIEISRQLSSYWAGIVQLPSMT